MYNYNWINKTIYTAWLRVEPATAQQRHQQRHKLVISTRFSMSTCLVIDHHYHPIAIYTRTSEAEVTLLFGHLWPLTIHFLFQEYRNRSLRDHVVLIWSASINHFGRFFHTCYMVTSAFCVDRDIYDSVAHYRKICSDGGRA